MPGRAIFKRARFAVLLFGAAVIVAGCGADHSWQGEFDARLEGASTSVEEALTRLGPDATKDEEFRDYASLGRELRYKGALIEGLDAPPDCADVQTKGLDHVKRTGLVAAEVHGPDYPTRLLKADRVSLEGEVRVLARIEWEAETCE